MSGECITKWSCGVNGAGGTVSREPGGALATGGDLAGRRWHLANENTGRESGAEASMSVGCWRGLRHAIRGSAPLPSRLCSMRGARLFATRALRLVHQDAPYHASCIEKAYQRGRGARRPRRTMSKLTLVGVVGVVAALVLPGCRKSEDSPTAALAAIPRVRVYCSVDEVFAREVLAQFEKESEIAVETVFDSEAGKTTGLVNRIIEESRAGRVRADVFWSSELFNTIRLARMGLLARYDSPAASDIPKRFRDAGRRWTSVAVRGRVIAYDPLRTQRENVPKKWADLAKPEVASRTALANPLFGTTRGHVAAMFALWGNDEGASFLSHLSENGVTIADGNSSAVRAVITGRVELAATDTDDVWVAQRAGYSIDLVYPDMGDGGTLWIPCSVALVEGGAEDDAAKRLVDYLVSARVEKMLAESDSRNIPVREKLREELGLKLTGESAVTFDAIADAMELSEKAVREILIR